MRHASRRRAVRRVLWGRCECCIRTHGSVTTPPSVETVLAALSSGRLLDLSRLFGCEIHDIAGGRDRVLAKFAAHLSDRLPALLRELGRDELRAVCRRHGLDAMRAARAPCRRSQRLATRPVRRTRATRQWMRARSALSIGGISAAAARLPEPGRSGDPVEAGRSSSNDSRGPMWDLVPAAPRR